MLSWRVFPFSEGGQLNFLYFQKIQILSTRGERLSRRSTRAARSASSANAAATAPAAVMAATTVATLAGIPLRKILKSEAGAVAEAVSAGSLWAGRACVVVVLRRPG